MKRPDYPTKRAMDIVCAGAGLILTAPVQLIIAFAVRVTSPGPALHRATRSGRHNEPFTLLKFRSMKVHTGTPGPAVTASGDPRITAVGGFLRRSKLDELPQLVNVLLGDMSLVGPRPEDPRYVDAYTPEHREILRWRPGITSPASVMFRDEERLLATFDDLDAGYRAVSAAKIEIDLEYFRRASLLTDLRCVGSSIAAVFNRGALARST